MSIVAMIIIGIAAGFLATRVLGIEADVPTTIAIGIGGALIGGFALRFLITIAGWMAGLVGAVLGAMALIWLWKTFGGR